MKSRKKKKEFYTEYTARNALKNGSFIVRLSAIVFGLGCLVHKQIAKGILYLTSEILLIVYMVQTGFYNLSKFRTLGDVEQQKVWNEAKSLYEYVDGDRSLIILLYGIVTLSLILVFFLIAKSSLKQAESFERILNVLKDRTAHGVEVRIFYDDVGSIGFINHDFRKRMEENDIACRVFNPIIPVLSVFMNNRDHRKITVIDGKVGFTGGYNLANEYFNITHPYGHWKDTGIRLEGDAVKSLTVMFLEMWNAVKKTDQDYQKYLPETDYQAKQDGFIQPYADSPLDDEHVGESVYMNLIAHAKKEIYFTTPYLIITDEMNRALGLAAKRGVDVRIVTPGIPDKKLIYKVTRSYYAGLVRQGVRIYEYTPGFIHAKQCVCDGEAATCGTINMDYRSLYLHFENGAFLYNCDAVKEMRKDFEHIFAESTEVTEKYKSGRSAVLRGTQCLLRLFAPLM